MEANGAARQPSLVRLTVVALMLALAFDALSTALAWDVVRAVEGTVQRAPVRAVSPTVLRDAYRRPESPQAVPEPPH